MKKLSESKINHIINRTVDYWTYTFGTKNHDTSVTKNELREYINKINNYKSIDEYDDGYMNTAIGYLKPKVKIILTNAYDKGIHYWAEGMIHRVTHHEALKKNKSLEDKIYIMDSCITRVLDDIGKTNKITTLLIMLIIFKKKWMNWIKNINFI
ncbi:8722_t:CDS:2 [Cetraspora pellucida]|uniref:8722_t:CDS:1 n=1 Tax=Cetraspora pellucida TaxID=1433469 RepID=A0A9N9JPJ0_9GLOM|nr:8722_t:CDS:2 [Cetraspora pellucida]